MSVCQHGCSLDGDLLRGLKQKADGNWDEYFTLSIQGLSSVVGCWPLKGQDNPLFTFATFEI